MAKSILFILLAASQLATGFVPGAPLDTRCVFVDCFQIAAFGGLAFPYPTSFSPYALGMLGAFGGIGLGGLGLGGLGYGGLGLGGLGFGGYGLGAALSGAWPFNFGFAANGLAFGPAGGLGMGYLGNGLGLGYGLMGAGLQGGNAGWGSEVTTPPPPQPVGWGANAPLQVAPVQAPAVVAAPQIRQLNSGWGSR